MKKIISVLLAMVMALGMVSVVAFAEETTVNIVVDKEWDDSHIPGANRPESVIVNLLQNGEPVDEAELNENNNWHFEWKELPLNDDSGMPITYTIRENTVPGYVSSITSNEIDGVIEFAVINTYVGEEPKENGIIVYKTDDEGNPLKDAYFTLTKVENGDTLNEPAYEAVSDENGVAIFDEVEEGSYVLEESLAPEGYIKSDEKHSLYVRGDGSVVIFSELMPNGFPYSPVTFVNNPVPFGVETETFEIPFVKYVDQIGTKVPGKMTFEFEIYNFLNTSGNQNYKVIENTVKTEGYGKFNGTIKFEVEDENLISEGFYVREKKGTEAGWTYSEEIWYVCPDMDGNWSFCPVENGEPLYNDPSDELSFVNSFYMNKVSSPNNPDRPKNPGVDEITPDEGKEEANPNTGAPVFGMGAVAILAGCATLIKFKK